MNMKRVVSFVSLFLFIAVSPFAQTVQPQHPGKIKQAIKKLNTLGSVLYFAAHPDDENTRLIAWLAKEKHFRTGYLSLTRGDGGQNLIGTEQAEELGLVRTNELLAARNVDGGEQFFSSAIDFGFSKTPEETFDIWTRESILADAVWVIRKFKPDVIITRFPPDQRAGHGHHQASALLAIEAFEAAADPNRFPEQLSAVTPWQAKRLLWNTSSFFQGSPPSSSHLLVNIGDYNPLLGESYGEIAAESRSNHKSQGFGAARQRGNIVERFEVLAGDAPKNGLFEGVETSWKRISGAERIGRLVAQIDEQFDMEHPEKSIDDLLDLLALVSEVGNNHWKDLKVAEIKDLILACGGIWFESYAPVSQLAVGEQATINTAYIVRRPNVNVIVGNHPLPFNEPYEQTAAFTASRITQPYWLRQAHGLGRFTVANQEDVGRPLNSDGPKTPITLAINGKSLTFERPIVYKYTHPVRGEVYEPLVVTPRITANIGQRALVFNGTQPKTIEVRFTGHTQGEVSAVARLQLPSGWRAEPSEIPLHFSTKAAETVSHITLYPAENVSLTDSLRIVLEYPNGTETAHALQSINYEHIPKITWFPPAKARLSKVETGLSAKHIGYLPGAGDLIPEALREIGLQVTLLNEQDVLSGDLSPYDAIVAGIRLYNVDPRIRYMQPRLMEYVKAGGTLVVQYNVSRGLQVDGIGPYPFELSRTRVTDETAPITVQLPESRVLNYPNKITQADFYGWVQERGLYFVDESAKQYDRPLRIADPGESPSDGSLLVARYGEGNFVYTSLAFFRQLPAGVPGAYRLFVNLLAKPID
ncbi:PIG-L family deacetylase [Parapedobacter sp. 10938]|uniref:PIG-L family deacetylase n=1 Tax=Parapedobacter flavus TaxID=3110225 RepID=UPI002DBC53AA|nr:PIG-L family deacetylase [Parapedobacter sp. 10938]MEC3881568.1 PIG-L family deacetylase [Parapedobacter sp. 10938]